MNSPLLVRTYENRTSPATLPLRTRRMQALPPIASFTFAEILRSADSADLQSAIDGIAEICAKNRMSLADEYGSHLPPQGEITAANTTAARPHLARLDVRRPLTTVPEASSSGSEGSGGSKKRKNSLFFFRSQKAEPIQPPRTMRIGSMGRTLSVSSTTAISEGKLMDHGMPSNQPSGDRAAHDTSKAVGSLHGILSRAHGPQSTG